MGTLCSFSYPKQVLPETRRQHDCGETLNLMIIEMLLSSLDWANASLVSGLH